MDTPSDPEAPARPVAAASHRRSFARSLRYWMRIEPGTPGSPWRAWAPGLEVARPPAGRSPLRALFIAQQAYTDAFRGATLAAKRDAAKRNARDGDAMHAKGPAFEVVTGQPLEDLVHLELFPFAVIGSNALNRKLRSPVLRDRRFPHAWAWRIVRAELRCLAEGRRVDLPYSAELATNPGMPTRLLEFLFERLPATRGCLVDNPALPETLAIRLAYDDRASGFVALAHPAVPPDVLRDVYERSRPDDRQDRERLKGIAANARCPFDVAFRLTRHPNRFVRRAIAVNSDLTWTDLGQLARDVSPGVRRAARHALVRRREKRGGWR